MAWDAEYLARQGRLSSVWVSAILTFSISDIQQVLAIFILTTVVIGGLYISVVIGRATFAHLKVCPVPSHYRNEC